MIRIRHFERIPHIQREAGIILHVGLAVESLLHIHRLVQAGCEIVLFQDQVAGSGGFVVHPADGNQTIVLRHGVVAHIHLHQFLGPQLVGGDRLHRDDGLVEGDRSVRLGDHHSFRSIEQRHQRLVGEGGIVDDPVGILLPLFFQQGDDRDELGRQLGRLLAPGRGETDIDGDEQEPELGLAGDLPRRRALDIEREVDGKEIPAAAFHAHARAYVEHEAERVELEEGVEAGVAGDTEFVPTHLEVEARADLEGVGRNRHVGLERELEDFVVQLHRQTVHLAHPEAFLRLVGRVETADGQQEALRAAPVQAEGHVAGDGDADDLGIDDGSVEPHALLEVDAAGEIDIDPDDAPCGVHPEGAHDNDLRRLGQLHQESEITLDDRLETDLAQEAEEELTVLGREIGDHIGLHFRKMLRVVDEVAHEEHLVQRSSPHAILDGVAADLAVQADGSAHGGQREAHAERNARMELGAQKHDQIERVPLRGARVAKQERPNGDFLHNIQGQDTEELAGIPVDGDETATLDDGSIDRDAETGGELQGRVQVEVADLAVFVLIIKDEANAQVLDGDDQRAAEIDLESRGGRELQLAALARYRAGVHAEGFDGEGAELLMVQVIDQVQAHIPAKVESLLEVVP